MDNTEKIQTKVMDDKATIAEKIRDKVAELNELLREAHSYHFHYITNFYHGCSLGDHDEAHLILKIYTRC